MEDVVNNRQIAVVSICLLCTIPAVSKTIRVPADFRTIGAALHTSRAGDTVMLARGFYKEVVELEDGITLMGEDRDSTFIIGRENRPVILAANHATVRNLTIKGGSAGVRCENKAMTIENTIITENRETGIHALVSLPQIRNNIIVRNDWTGIFCESSRALNARIENNIIAENSYCAIKLAGASEVIIQNNIICNNGQYGIFADKESRRARIEYNNFYNNRHTNNQFVYIGNTNLSLDPAFEPLRAEVYSYAGGPKRSFKQMGRDGTDMGLLAAEQLAADAADRDRDGVDDATDQCAGVAEDRDGYQDEDGCPEFDNDNDGVYDKQDRCPDEPEDFDKVLDMDGCPDPDNDNDGILDSADQCPEKPETKNGYKDDDGCPDEVPAQ